MVTMYDVARLAAVSPVTVSRYVNGSGYVGRATRERVQAAIDELGYVPSRLARSLTTKRTGLIGFVVSDLGNPFTAEVVAGLQARADQEGHLIVVAATEGDEQRTLRTIAALRAHQVDGLVVTPPESPRLEAELRTTVAAGKPVVLIGMEFDPPFADRITTSTYEGGRAAMAHLLSLGHHRIGFVGAPRLAWGRRRAYDSALAAAGLPAAPDLVSEGALTREGGLAAGLRLLDLPDRPTAIFAANDSAAMGVLHAAYQRGLRVPDDLSVMGFDDTDIARHAVPPLTTVAQPIQQVGREAVDALLARLSGDQPDGPIERRLPCALVVRDSTAPNRERDG